MSSDAGSNQTIAHPVTHYKRSLTPAKLAASRSEENPRPRSRASTKSGNPILTPHPAGVDAPDRAAMLGSIGWWHSCNSRGREGNRRSPATMYAGRSRSAALQRLSGAQRKLIPHTYLIQLTIRAWQPRAHRRSLCELVGCLAKASSLLMVVRRRRSLVAVDWRHVPLCPPCMRRRA